MDTIVIVIVAFIVGGIISFFGAKSMVGKDNDARVKDLNGQADKTLADARASASRITEEAKRKADGIVSKAEKKNEEVKQRKIKEAKKKFADFKSKFEAEKVEHKNELRERAQSVVDKENALKDKEVNIRTQEKEFKNREKELEQTASENKAIRDNLDKQVKIVAKKKEELDQANEERIRLLENVAKLTEAEAKEQILEAVRAKAETDAMSIRKEVVQAAHITANKDAKKVVIQSIQRMCAEFTIENTVSVFPLESDDLKGQIIGREGRNIRAIEAATGAEIVVDDTPEAIVISSFDPIRREVCRLSLKRLVADGRIHPARIEEVVAKTRKQLDEQIVEIGERTVIELDIHGLNPYLVKMVGRMRFRSSYGQNLLKHSIETANLCGIMAAELGLSNKDAKLAKRAGLLHDIGKVAEEETELSHAILGMKLCEKHNESDIVSNAVGAHHDEVEMTNMVSPIVQACDAISGARPGARREILESYMKRIGELETIAMSHDGVQKAYAMQAGRELRVMVESEKVSDEYADSLAFMISEKIQDEMQYPGQIKVTVIREKRAVSFAR